MKILVTGHGIYADGVKSFIKCLIGLDDEILAINFDENKSYEEYEKEVNEFVNSFERVLVFADIIGGTPFQVSSRAVLTDEGNEKFVVAGLPMACMLNVLLNTSILNDFSQVREKLNDAVNLANESILVLSKEVISND